MNANEDEIEELIGYLFYDLYIAKCLNEKGIGIVAESFIKYPELKKELIDTVRGWCADLDFK